ncbi:hypothetical protein PVL29_002467 [Vitis rotundifolia]|uniref:Uncharacterized protein n=1 Tax=Vitis rotundifolia TaxID=103349 RepID=A0AA39AI42_VITRO|nr:hypothetical protein PVL29_002467 [Vitis rotundifolia]
MWDAKNIMCGADPRHGRCLAALAMFQGKMSIREEMSSVVLPEGALPSVNRQQVGAFHGDVENNLEKIKHQLTSDSRLNLLQGPLLKRSETLRTWNERWVILDPTTGKMEYKIQRNEWEWLYKVGTIATVVVAANSTALECSKEIEAAMQISMRNVLEVMMNEISDDPMDDLTIMKETLRVKDEKLQHLARDLRARDSTIKELAEKLFDTVEAVKATIMAAHTMDEQRWMACAEIERLRRDLEKQLGSSMLKLKEFEEKVMALCKERDQLVK